MAEDEELEDELDDDEQDDDDESSEGGSKKKLFIIIGVVLLLVVGGAAAAYFTGLMEPLTSMISGGEPADGGEGENPAGNIVFHDIPEILVNLNTGGRKQSFLKIRISLELASAADIPKIEMVMPRVIDSFQVYLRELRIDDLKGSAGMYRLREELLMRVIIASAPATVNDVLFKEMIVQ